MLKLKIELVHPNAKIPIKATPTAACWDVFAADIKREADDFYIVDLGFKLQPPPGYKVILVPRSSITKTYLIQQNSPGQGDEDYRGEYKYVFRMLPLRVNNNVSYSCKFVYNDFPYKVGDRIGQIFLEKVIPIQFIQVDTLSETERGEGGFGSTGK